MLGLACLVSPIFSEDQTFYIDKFNGLNLFYDSRDIGDGEAQQSENVLTDSGYLEKRPGNSRVGTIVSGSPVLNLKEFVTISTKYLIVHASSTLYQTNFTGPLTQIATGTLGYDYDSVSAFNKHYFVNKLEPGFGWDGTSTSTVSGMPVAKFIEFGDERLYVANTAASSSEVDTSSYGADNGWAVPAVLTADAPNRFYFNKDDGEVITCFQKTPWGKFVGKRHSSHVLKGYDNTNYYKRLIHPRIGCVDDRSFQMADDMAIWLGDEAIYGWDGTNNPVNLSQEIEPLVRSIRQLGNDDKFIDATFADYMAGTTTFAGPDALTFVYSVSEALMLPKTASFVDTSSANFSLGTISTNTFQATTMPSISTNAPFGSLSLAVTTVGFINAGFEDSNLLVSSMGWTIMSQRFSSAANGTDQFVVVSTAGMYGNKALRFERCSTSELGNFTLTILDSDTSTPLKSSAIVIADPSGTSAALTTGTVTLNELKISSSNVYLRVGTLDSTIRSVSFFQGQTLQFMSRIESCPRSAGCINVGEAAGTTSCVFFDAPYATEQRLTSGTFISRSFDTAFSSPSWGAFDVAVTTSQNYRINFQVETSTNGTDSWTPRSAINDLERPVVVTNRYIRYVSSFSATDSASTSRIDDVFMSAVATGSFYSQVHNVGDNVTTWGTFDVTDVVNPASRVTYWVRGASSPISVLSSTPGWTAQTNHQIVSISTFPYFQWGASTTIHSTTETLTISQAKLAWLEGSSITAASSFYNGRYFLSVTTSPASVKNDTTLVWQKNKKWTVFNGPSYGAMAVFDNNIHAGDASTNSYVWKIMQPNVYTDDGAGIASKWVTKDFGFGEAIQYKSLSDIWIEAQTSSDTILNIGFAANKNENFTSKNYDIGKTTGVIVRRIPGLVDGFALGKYFKFVVSNSQPGRTFKFNSLGVRYSVAPMRFDDDE